MKRELWDKVRAGAWVIYADEYDGVHRAMVKEIDIKMYEEGEPSRWGHPYGLTKDTGTVKIVYDKTETIENLADLIRYSQSRLRALEKAWTKLQTYKASAESVRETFLGLLREFKA